LHQGLPHPTIASAILDRLIHRAHLVPIVSDSFRTRDLKAKNAKGGEHPKRKPA